MKQRRSPLDMSAAALANGGFIPVCLIIAAAVFFRLMPSMFAVGHVEEMISSSAKVLIVASGLTVVMASGGIDVSIGGQVSLGLACMAMLSAWGASPVMIIICGLAIGAACGAINGMLVASWGVPPFIATLASNFIFNGIGRTILTRGVSFSFKTFLAQAMSWRFWIFRLDFAIALLCILMTFFLLNWTCWGRYVVAVGINENSVHRAGVSVSRVKWRCYLVNGLFCAIGGFVLSGNEGIAIANADVDLTLTSLAAIALAHAEVFLDRKRVARVKVWKIVAAVFLLELLSKGLGELFSGDYTQQIILSIIILGAFAMDRRNRKPLGSEKLST